MSAMRTDVVKRWGVISVAVVNKENNPGLYERFYIGSIQKQTCGLEPASETKKIRGWQTTRSSLCFRLTAPLLDVQLTPREVQVLYLICHDLTNIQVADRMGLSPRTVEYYIKNMRKKTLTMSKKHLVKQTLRTNFLSEAQVKNLNLE